MITDHKDLQAFNVATVTIVKRNMLYAGLKSHVLLLVFLLSSVSSSASFSLDNITVITNTSPL